MHAKNKAHNPSVSHGGDRQSPPHAVVARPSHQVSISRLMADEVPKPKTTDAARRYRRSVRPFSSKVPATTATIATAKPPRMAPSSFMTSSWGSASGRERETSKQQ